MRGLMQDVPLTLTMAFDRAERLFGDKKVVTYSADGRACVTYGRWSERTRQLAGALAALGIGADARVGTFAWNTARHLELYFAVPCTGRVLHTLNIRLAAEEVAYIANHAEDEAVFVDRSLLPAFWPLVDDLETVRHIVVMDDGGDVAVPDDARVTGAAVIAVPDERWGERPLACVVPVAGTSLTADEVRSHLAGRVAKWWIPEHIEFIEEVPKTSVGKFSKKDLRARFATVRS